MRSSQLQAAIAGLEAQRAALGDEVVDAALSPLYAELARLEAGPPAGQPPALEAERKIVTILFADLSGFTALAEALDPEALRDLINACFASLVPAVTQYGGTVEKFIGDEIMALFGAPSAHENDPERALRAALYMARALDEFNAQHATALDLHFGINTGLVVVGGLGFADDAQYAATGDAVNLAARLADHAESGEILVGQDTYRPTAHLFSFEPRPPLHAKGKAEPVAVYRLLGHQEAPGWIQFTSPLVGRGGDASQLAGLFEAAAQGRGAVAAVIGEPGLGKSRLVAEVGRPFEQAAGWTEGRALAYAQAINFWIARDLLCGLIGAVPDSAPERMRSALAEAVERVLPHESATVIPYLARLLDLPLDAPMQERVRYLKPEALQAQMLVAFRDYLRALARACPQILICEDLHWADPSSLGLLESLLPLTAEVPLLLLFTYRPLREEEVWVFHERVLGRLGASFHRFELQPLTRAQGGELLDNLLVSRKLPAQARELILDKAEGNPFFLEELIRSVWDIGLVSTLAGVATAEQVMQALRIPDTLQGVIAARIDRLRRNDKRTLQAAAVIGRIFQRQVLLHLGHHQGLEADDSLGELERRELVRRRAQRTAEMEYIFKHTLTQEVAYHSLLLARRRELHRQVAEILVDLFPDKLADLAATLAYHYEAAEQFEPAIDCLLEAAERARQTYANAEALGFYQRALAQLARAAPADGTPVEEAWQRRVASVHEQQADLLLVVARYAQARQACEAALALLPDREIVWRARLRRKQGTAWVRERSTEAIAAYAHAEETLGPPPATDQSDWWHEWLELMLERLWQVYMSNDMGAMQALVGRARPVIEVRGTPQQRSRLFESLALIDLRRYRYYMLPDKAVANLQASLAASNESGELAAIARAHFVLGFVRLWRREFDEAETQLQTALGQAHRIGDVELQILGLTYLANVARWRGQVDETQRRAERALKTSTSADARFYMGLAEGHLAWAARRRGLPDVARRHGQRALELFEPGLMTNPFFWTARWPLLGLELEAGDLGAAVTHARAMLAPNQMRQPGEITSALEGAIQAWEAGEAEPTRLRLQTALQQAERLGVG
jgi:class 3 adenylate cyclase/tetratricopeptide (TPR) repeat protein